MIFQISNSDFGFKFNGADYRFIDVVSIAIEDPEQNKLTRGSNEANKLGLPYKEGGKDPKHWTVTILNMTADLKNLLDQVFANKDRVDVYCIDRTSGSSKMAKNAILCKRPQQLGVTESPDSMNVVLEFDSFDSNENHKDS